jgi:hypothetical protein
LPLAPASLFSGKSVHDQIMPAFPNFSFFFFLGISRLGNWLDSGGQICIETTKVGNQIKEWSRIIRRKKVANFSETSENGNKQKGNDPEQQEQRQTSKENP